MNNNKKPYSDQVQPFEFYLADHGDEKGLKLYIRDKKIARYKDQGLNDQEIAKKMLEDSDC